MRVVPLLATVAREIIIGRAPFARALGVKKDATGDPSDIKNRYSFPGAWA